MTQRHKASLLRWGSRYLCRLWLTKRTKEKARSLGSYYSAITICLGFMSMITLTAWTPNAAPGVATLYSQSFQLDAECRNTDMVYFWNIGAGPTEKQFIRPWLHNDITIRGVELLADTPPNMFWMVGNNADGDAMVFLAKNELHRLNWFPSGTGFAFPGTEHQEQTYYIDLHGACARGHVTILLTLYYTQP